MASAGATRTWDAEQWCAALVQAGRLSAIAPAPGQTGPRTRRAPPAPRPSAEWLDEALAQAVCFATEDAGQKLWGEAVEKRKAHQITTAECEQIKERIKARWKELDDTKGAQGSLDDAWTPKVEEIGCEDDANRGQRRNRGRTQGRAHRHRPGRADPGWRLYAAPLIGNGAPGTTETLNLQQKLALGRSSPRPSTGSARTTCCPPATDEMPSGSRIPAMFGGELAAWASMPEPSQPARPA